MKAKIILFYLLVLLTACSQVQPRVPTPTQIEIPIPTLTVTPTLVRTPIPTYIFKDGSQSINAFKPSETCPNICWMGIHPGTTSAGQAVTFLKNARDTKQLEIFGNTIFASNSGFYVSLLVSKNTIETLHLTPVSLKLGEMMSVLGEPKDVQLLSGCDISLRFRCLRYQIYYPSWNALLVIHPQDRTGPSPYDNVMSININIPNEWGAPSQPWLGYGHADEYMQNVPLPSPTPYLVP